MQEQDTDFKWHDVVMRKRDTELGSLKLGQEAKIAELLQEIKRIKKQDQQQHKKAFTKQNTI